MVSMVVFWWKRSNGCLDKATVCHPTMLTFRTGGVCPPSRIVDRNGGWLMTHVLIGRVVLGEAGGVAVPGCTGAAEVLGYDEVAGDRLTVKAETASDGRFVLVFRYQNVTTLTVRVQSPSGV